MFSHLMIGTNDIDGSRAFYNAVLGVLGAGEPAVDVNSTGQTRLFYMHDGSIGTLAEVVAFYDGGGVTNPLLDSLIRPLGLTAREQDDLVAFLRALTGSHCEALVADALAAPVGEAGRNDPPWWR